MNVVPLIHIHEQVHAQNVTLNNTFEQPPTITQTDQSAAITVPQSLSHDQPVHITGGRWRDSWTDCCADRNICCATFCCAPVVLGQLYHVVSKGSCLCVVLLLYLLTGLTQIDMHMNDGFAKVYVSDGVEMSWLTIFLAIVSGACTIGLLCHIRLAIRTKDRIPGSLVEDLCCACCCSSCITCQMMRHILLWSARRTSDGMIIYNNYRFVSADGADSSFRDRIVTSV